MTNSRQAEQYPAWREKFFLEMNKDARVLIVDNSRTAQAYQKALSDICDFIKIIEDPKAALEQIEKSRFDLVLSELNFSSEINGIDLLIAAKKVNPTTAVILITDNPTIDSCKQAIRRGAYEYLEKPVKDDYLRLICARAVPAPRQFKTTKGDFVFEGILSRSKTMQAVYKVARRVAPTDISVLIEGESGTGKELLARAIHYNSQRRDNVFCPINCAGLTESLLESELFGHSRGAFTGASYDRKGLFETADQGTLFLDEIGDMPLNMQAKLLRVLEDGLVTPVGSNKSVRVDVRVISATNHDLSKLVEEKKFRQDLYFRIKGVSLSLPPLRVRPEDIEELFGYFLKKSCDETGVTITRITEPAMEALKSYPWPGNIRQLRNVVRTMVVMCDSDTLDIGDIPLDIHHIKRLGPGVTASQESPEQVPVTSAGQSLDQVEKEHIRRTLEATDGNRAEAARMLKIGERTLYRKIKEYGL